MLLRVDDVVEKEVECIYMQENIICPLLAVVTTVEGKQKIMRNSFHFSSKRQLSRVRMHR